MFKHSAGDLMNDLTNSMQQSNLKLMIVQQVDKTFYKTREFIAVFTSPYSGPDESSPNSPISFI
jgi:hypothetical protein